MLNSSVLFTGLITYTCMHVTEWNMRQIGINLPGFYVNYAKNIVHSHKNCNKIDNQYSNQDLYLDSI